VGAENEGRTFGRTQRGGERAGKTENPRRPGIADEEGNGARSRGEDLRKQNRPVIGEENIFGASVWGGGRGTRRGAWGGIVFRRCKVSLRRWEVELSCEF